MDQIDPAVNIVYLTILGIFFMLTIASWLISSRDWFKDEDSTSPSADQPVEAEIVDPSPAQEPAPE